MRFFFVILPCFFLVSTCIVEPAGKQPLAEKDTIQKEKNKMVAIIEFEKQVKPIFIKNCSPCHFTGGKMYEKLPFDKDTTILNHYEAILKRIKNEEENTTLKNFVLQNKNGLPESKP
jgi:hypothetical protein